MLYSFFKWLYLIIYLESTQIVSNVKGFRFIGLKLHNGSLIRGGEKGNQELEKHRLKCVRTHVNC